MKYNIKLSKGKININGKEYDIPYEVAEFIIYETSTRDDIIQTRDVYERTIDKAIDRINDYKIYCKENKGFTEYTDIEIEAIEPILTKMEDILKVAR